jgi:leucyl/phenylalanyl-tRNA--protein transferase
LNPRKSLSVAVPVFLTPDVPGLPSPEAADSRGVVAVGGDLSVERLLLGYRTGIFPWYSAGLPIYWHSPDPRFVLPCADLRVGRSLRKVIRRHPYELRLDTAFGQVIRRCAEVPRPGQDGTWITEEMIAAYESLHALGHAHCVEAWSDGELVGGAYGICVGGVFCGESMFALAPDASKVAFVALVRQLELWGVDVIDCQVHTEHLERFGAVHWSRSRFLEELARLRDRPAGPEESPWSFEETFDPLESRVQASED